MNPRRSFLGAAGLLALLGAGGAHAQPAPPAAASAPAGAPSTPPRGDEPPLHDMSGVPKDWMGREQIGMLLYPGFTALDLVGPQYMFGNLMGATVHLVSRTLEPVMSDTRLAIVPNATYDTVPRDLDVLFVPGAGSAIFDVMQDEAAMAFIRDRASRARWVASVCTGSVILGRAGLLRGRRATSHWISREELQVFGATPVDERVVWDGNLVTGAGVSAGLDLGLALLGRLKGDTFAESIQLLAEYDPQPPYRSGRLSQARPQVRSMMEGMFTGFRRKIRTLTALN